jgi:hypothetical protein
MAHIDPTTGSWEPDEDGPAPAQAGLIGEQAAPVPPPVPLPVTPPPQLPSVQLPEPHLPPPGGAPASPMLTPGAPPSSTAQDVQPYQPQAPQLPPVGRVVSPAERATLEAQDTNTAARVATEQQGAELDKAGAQSKLDAAQRDETAHIDQEKDRQRIEAEFQKRIEAANAKAQADYQAYRQMGLKDPEAEQSFGHKVLAAIAIGLGQYAAGITGGSNQALNIIQAANAQNIALQKAAIEKKLKEAELSGKDAAEVEKERADAYRRLDLKGSALLQASADKLKVELARVGVPAAQIASNADVQKLEAEALQKREGAMESIRKDETILQREDMADQTRRARRMGGGAGGSGAAASAGEKLAQYALDNPGDIPGLYRLAAQLKVPKPEQAVAAAINHTKSTESQTKDAKQAAIGLRAVNDIEQSGYTPAKGEIQKWLNNQKQVDQAADAGKGGGLGGVLGGAVAGLAQGHGLMAQSETDGLSPEAQKYFANVRRFMETIGRAQSGAAISPKEWTNFFNQYGPNSSGGLQAARQYLVDQFHASGTAGRQITGGAGPAGESAPAPAKPAKGSSDRESAKQWLREHPNDPRADAVRKKLASMVAADL